MISLNLSLLNKPEVVDEDKMYKDLNHLFYEKNMEQDFLTFKKGIKQNKVTVKIRFLKTQACSIILI